MAWQKKAFDMIAANQVGQGLGFDSEMNALTVFWGNEKKQMEKASKTRLARILITLIADRYNEKNSNKNASIDFERGEYISDIIPKSDILNSIKNSGYKIQK